jgi:hypothetical protein
MRPGLQHVKEIAEALSDAAAFEDYGSDEFIDRAYPVPA